MSGYRILCQKPGKIGFDTTEQSKVAGFGVIRDYASGYGIKLRASHHVRDGPRALVHWAAGDAGHADRADQPAAAVREEEGAELNEVIITAIHDRDKKRIDRLNDDVLMAFKFVALWGTLQRKGELHVKPEEVRRMRYTMVHDYERLARTSISAGSKP